MAIQISFAIPNGECCFAEKSSQKISWNIINEVRLTLVMRWGRISLPEYQII